MKENIRVQLMDNRVLLFAQCERSVIEHLISQKQASPNVFIHVENKSTGKSESISISEIEKILED